MRRSATGPPCGRRTNARSSKVRHAHEAGWCRPPRRRLLDTSGPPGACSGTERHRSERYGATGSRARKSPTRPPPTVDLDRADTALTSCGNNNDHRGDTHVKKLINDPATSSRDALARNGGRPSRAARGPREPHRRTRADAPVAGQGRGDLRRRLRARAAARRLRRPRHARRRLSPGEVFTSPVPDQMLAATKAVDGGAGVLHIVKNYTGDVLNFQTRGRARRGRGHRGRAVVVDDDVAVQDSPTRPAGAAPAAPWWSRRSPARAADERRRPGRGGRDRAARSTRPAAASAWR